MADRVERLTNLLALLLETPRPLSLVEIAGELGAQYPDKESARRGAFERDKSALRAIGVPIDQEYVEGGPYAGQTRYWIDRSRYELADLQLEPDEMRALQVAVAATRTGSSSGQEALWKLGSGAVDDHAAVVATLPAIPALPVLREAVAGRTVVRLHYRGAERDLEPWGLLLRQGFWYVIGRDRLRAEQRTFRVDRIEGDVALVSGETFERPPNFDPRAAFPSDPKLIGADADVDAVVRIDAARAPATERELGADRVVARGDDGSIDVRVPCGNRAAFRSWVLGFMEHAEVVEPADVRRDMIEWLERVAGA